MSDSDRRPPLSVFIPAHKFVEHNQKFASEWWEEQHASKKGTYPMAVLVKWHVSPEGVRLTIDPWQWMLKFRSARYSLVESRALEDAYEAEQLLAGEVAAEEARMKAILEFPTFKRWLLLRELADTPM